MLYVDYSNEAYWYNRETIDALILLHADYSNKGNIDIIERHNGCIDIVTRWLFQYSILI